MHRRAELRQWPLSLGLAASAALASALGGCDRPDVAVVCHNANCTSASDPADDDTVAALTASLAMTADGQSVVDGVEIDLLWSGRTRACLFAHDHSQPNPETADAAGELIAAHLERGNAAARWPFLLKLELKAEVDEHGSPHSDVELNEHAACALGVFHTVSAAAERSGGALEVYFDSESPELLRELAHDPEWPTLARPQVLVKLSAAFTVPGVTSAKLGDFEMALDAVSVHPDWIMNAERSLLRARNIEITLWSRTVGARQLRAIADIEPRFVSTSDALRLRRWLGD